MGQGSDVGHLIECVLIALGIYRSVCECCSVCRGV